MAVFADRNVNPRGGQMRRDLSQDEYDAITEALEDGATADDLKDRFRIGWTRAKRLVEVSPSISSS